MQRLLTWMGAGLSVIGFVTSSEAQQSPFESRTFERGGLKITVGQPRMIMRGPMFPWGILFDDGSIVVIASSAEEGGPPAYVRSTDRGDTWRAFKPPSGYCIPNVQLPDGTALNASAMPPPIADRPGYYQTLRGADIYKGSLNLPDDKFYSLSPPTTPLLICYSDDGGEHWTKPVATREARGCMPQLAYDGKILALSSGALHYPRWGSGIVFSLDGGHTWTDLINYAPFFTSGYGALLAIAPGRFLAIFDYAAPQPWKDHTAHWVGAVDIKVERP